MTIILGIDPGSRITGYGLIQYKRNACTYIASGCIKTSGDLIASRLLQIYGGIKSIIEQYQPEHAAIEKVFVHENPDSALKLGQARGALLVAVAGFDLSVAEYSPRTIKQTVVGYGGAEKQQVQQMVKCLLGLSDVPQKDAADALAVAMCHASYCRGTL